MAPHSNEESVDTICQPGGDDTPPLMSKVADPPPVSWGGITSSPRTLSPQYIEFLNRHREVRDGK